MAGLVLKLIHISYYQELRQHVALAVKTGNMLPRFVWIIKKEYQDSRSSDRRAFIKLFFTN